MPQALLRTDLYTCRTENDVKYFERSPRMFNNPTKQDRYGAGTFSALPGGTIPMPHGGVNEVPLTQQAINASYPINFPGGKLPPRAATQQQSRALSTCQPTNTSVVGVTTCGSFAPV